MIANQRNEGFGTQVAGLGELVGGGRFGVGNPLLPVEEGGVKVPSVGFCCPWEGANAEASTSCGDRLDETVGQSGNRSGNWPLHGEIRAQKWCQEWESNPQVADVKRSHAVEKLFLFPRNQTGMVNRSERQFCGIIKD